MNWKRLGTRAGAEVGTASLPNWFASHCRQSCSGSPWHFFYCWPHQFCTAFLRQTEPGHFQRFYRKTWSRFLSGDLTLHGVVYKPEGEGPFPAVLYNHGSDAGMLSKKAFDALGPVFAKRGWVFFGPNRRGQGLSKGGRAVHR